MPRLYGDEYSDISGSWGPPQSKETPPQPSITADAVTHYTMLPKEQGGWNASDVEWMIKQGMLDPATATRGLVEADRMKHAARGAANVTPMRGWANPYGMVQPQTWEQAAQQPYQYSNPYRFTPLQGIDWSTPLRSFDVPDVTWQSFPEQKRSEMQSWLQGPGGYSAGGSLGRYGLRSYSTQGQGVTPQSLGNIPDESLRKWALAMFGLGAAPM